MSIDIKHSTLKLDDRTKRAIRKSMEQVAETIINNPVNQKVADQLSGGFIEIGQSIYPNGNYRVSLRHPETGRIEISVDVRWSDWLMFPVRRIRARFR